MANEKQQFVEELKALLQKDVAEVKEQVEQIKTQFYRQYHQDLEAQKQAVEVAATEAGETLENWVPQVDETEQEFRELLMQYKQKKAELLKKAVSSKKHPLILYFNKKNIKVCLFGTKASVKIFSVIITVTNTNQ
jgi:hypothetical protein